MSNPHDTKRPETAQGVTGDLASRIALAKRGQLKDTASSEEARSNNASGISRGLRLGSEFAAAILVGSGIGYFLDQWLGTGPWIMLVMLLIGFAAGIMNVIRAVAEMNAASTAPPEASIGLSDDDDAHNDR